jgi:hypothetical protein
MCRVAMALVWGECREWVCRHRISVTESPQPNDDNATRTVAVSTMILHSGIEGSMGAILPLTTSSQSSNSSIVNLFFA